MIEEFKQAETRAVDMLINTLNKDSKKAVSEWLDAVERVVHGTRYGNYNRSFNLFRDRLGTRD